MATTLKILTDFANTAVPTSPVDLYKPTSPRSGLVTSIALTAGAGTPSVLLRADSGSTTAIFFRGILGTVPILLTDVLSVGKGQRITIESVSGTADVKAVVMGLERD